MLQKLYASNKEATLPCSNLQFELRRAANCERREWPEIKPHAL